MDNELDGPTSRFIKDHLEGCPRCRAYFYEFRKIDDTVHGLPSINFAPDFSGRVVKAAIGTSALIDEKPIPFSSRLRFALVRLSEEIFGLFYPGFLLNILTLEEFSDSPPLSMGFIYLRLIEQPKTRVLI